MAEDSTEQENNEELISGLEHGDIKPNFYEGGFKTWECALDLAKLVVGEDTAAGAEDGDCHIIEVCVPPSLPFIFGVCIANAMEYSLVLVLQYHLWRYSHSSCPSRRHQHSKRGLGLHLRITIPLFCAW